MTVYALQRNGGIKVIQDVRFAPESMINVLDAALKNHGLRWTPKQFSGAGWVRTDKSKSVPTDVVRVEAWDKPNANAFGLAARAGQVYCWVASELTLQAAAYELAGGKMDDYLPTLVA